ncbi:hypothetical protein HC749_20635 [Arthrobacter sp. S13_S34]|nr:hypothetical protein [Arthrobacter sp. S13_S34]
MSTEPSTPEEPDHRRYTAMNAEGEAAVGRIAIWAAYVEQNLVDLCASLINSNPKVGHAVTANMSASSMIQLAKKLLSESKDVSADKKARTLAALTEAKAVLELRNKILHATVGGSFVKGKTAFYNSRRKTVPGVAGRLPQLEAALHGPEDLDEIGARLYKAQEELWDCVH